MKYSNLILLISILFCSCSQTDDIVTSQPKETNIDIFATIDNSYAQSRSDDGTIVPFSDGATLGLYILSNGATTPFADNSNNINIKATKDKDSDSWTYVMQSSSYEFTSLIIATNKDSEKADFYAYAPWFANANVNSDTYTHINFPYFYLNISANQVDLKWARQNSEDTPNKGILLDGNDKKVHLTFQRATALISCKFATAHQGTQEGKSEIHITGFTVTKRHSPIYKSGKLDITTGKWGNKTAADSYSSSRGTLILGTSTEANPYPTLYDIYFLPITKTEMESSSGDDLMQITFNQYTTINGTPATITLKKSQFPNGLEAGKKYTLYITWEDYLRIDNIKVDEGWTDVKDEIIKEI